MSEAKPSLWAPWRMEYIQRAKSDACVFCTYAGHGPAEYRADLVLVAQAHAFVVLNRFPFGSGHILIVPRRHVSALEDLSDEEYEAHAHLVRDAIKAMKAAVKPEGVNLGYNLGKAAGAGIADHLHAHALPRWVGDTNFMPVIGGLHVMPQYLDDTWVALRPHFDAIPGEKAAFP